MQGEKVLWTSQPDPSVLFTKSDLFLIPFSLFWGGFAFIWEGSVLVAGANAANPIPIVFALFGIPFVLIGLYIIFGRFFYKVSKKKKTYYAITDKRILVLTTFMGKHLEAAYINTLPAINKSIGSNGTGTVTFGNNNMYASMYGNTGLDFFTSFYGSTAPTFYDVKNAEQVYEQVMNLRNSQ